MFSDADLFRLEQARFQRLREIVDLPQQCVQHLDLDGSLSVIAINQADADQLLAHCETLQAVAYRIFGAPELNLWFNARSLWHGQTLFSAQVSELELGATELGDAPMTATIDREAIAATTRTELNDAVNSQIDEVIQAEVRAVLDESSLQQRVRDRLNLFLGGGGVATVEPPAVVANGKTPKPQTPKAPKPLALKLPRGFAGQVSNRYKQVIEKFLPTGDDRATYLAAICGETPEGKDWLMKIAAAIGKKYKNTDVERIYQGLLDNARKLQG